MIDGLRVCPYLASPRFRNDAVFAQFLRQQHLADRVVDFVGPRMGQVFSFDPNLGPTKLVGQAFGVVHRRGSSNEIPA